MIVAAYLVFALQGLLLALDEAAFHRRRDLPRWERIGHPVDTAVFLLALSWAMFAERTPGNVAVFVVLGAASCLVITKDEWVHAERCSGAENWLHAVLFVLHPVALFGANALWAAGAPIWPVAACVLAFGVYQFVRWNVFPPVPA